MVRFLILAFEKMMTGGILITKFVFVGALWGCTNPLLKKGTQEMPAIKRETALQQFLAQMYYTLMNWKFVIPFALNQSASLLYVYLLGSSDISMAVPICNSLTFVFTAITSVILGEYPARPSHTYMGMLLVLLGIFICFHSKLKS